MTKREIPADASASDFGAGLHIDVEARIEEILAEYAVMSKRTSTRQALQGLARTLAYTEEALRGASTLLRKKEEENA